MESGELLGIIIAAAIAILVSFACGPPFMVGYEYVIDSSDALN